LLGPSASTIGQAVPPYWEQQSEGTELFGIPALTRGGQKNA